MTTARIACLSLGALLLGSAACSTAASPDHPPEAPTALEEAGTKRPPEILASAVISQREESTSEAEPSLVVSTDGRIVVVWYSIVGSELKIAYRMSASDGATFGDIHEMPLPEDNNVCANAALAIDADGGVYLTYACQKRTSTARENARVWAARSLRGSETFDAPVEVSPAVEGGTYDQPRIAVVHGGGILVTFMQSTPAGSALVATSTRDFVDFTPTTVHESVGFAFANFARPCASRTTARVTLIALDLGVGVTMFTSDDGGVTWPKDRRVVISKPNERDKATPFQECVAGDGNEVFTVYGVTKDDWASSDTPLVIPMLHKLRLARTSDGQTVDSLVDVEEPGLNVIQPSLALDDSGGVDIAYYAGSKGGDTAGSYRFRRSLDKGATFQESVVVQEPLVFETSRASRRTPGDYMGLWGAAGKLYVAYTDTKDKTGHIAFYRTTLP
jgi:hypothetical protein